MGGNLGVIERIGSGKSSLERAVCRTLTPIKGYVMTPGRGTPGRHSALRGPGAFIDQPVKIGPSCMMRRLVFPVIAHVDADFPIIDQALSVGDSADDHVQVRWG
jgi:ABC-type polysaccharide/polyol phosphate transport system ATPase subunit